MSNSSFLKLREKKFVSTSLDKVHLDGTFSGYASVFNEVDLGNDCIAPKAFTKSLIKRDACDIRMLFQHNPDEPIGVWEEVTQTQHGLKVKGRITQSVSRGAEVLELMRAGAIDGLSIGFKTVRAKQDKQNNVRRILEADLWEISIVTFPMQQSARVDCVKSNYKTNTLNKPTIREFERWLVREAGLSRADAKTVITKGYSHLAGRREAAGNSNDLAKRIRASAGNLLSSVNRNSL